MYSKSSGPLHIRSFCTAYDQLTTQKLLIMELLYSAASFFNSRHLNKREALGALRILMADDLGIADLANAIEKLEKVAFRGVER